MGPEAGWTEVEVPEKQEEALEPDQKKVVVLEPDQREVVQEAEKGELELEPEVAMGAPEGQREAEQEDRLEEAVVQMLMEEQVLD